MTRILGERAPGWRRSVFALVIIFLGAGSAHAAFIPLFDTGVDSSGNVLPHNTVGDPHYTLISVPGGPTQTRIITSAGGFPIGPWLGDNSVSRWIGPNSDDDLDGPVGDYIYRTTFDLTGFNLSTVVINGQYATDNSGFIRLNGNVVGPSSPFVGYDHWTSFSLNSGFTSGINTLDFVVNNGGGPTGLRVEMTGTGDVLSAVPAPPAVALFAVGLVGLAGFRAVRRKIQTIATA